MRERTASPSAFASVSDSPVRAAPVPQAREIAVPSTPGKRASPPATLIPATRPALLAIVPRW